MGGHEDAGAALLARALAAKTVDLAVVVDLKYKDQCLTYYSKEILRIMELNKEQLSAVQDKFRNTTDKTSTLN